jgi:hypothetical protein
VHVTICRASCKSVTLTREEEHLVIEEHNKVTCALLLELPLGGWSRLKR